MFTSTNRILATTRLLALLLACATTFARAPEEGPTDAGTVISNRAEASYSDASGATYDTASETVTVTVLHVATVAVTPDETESSDTFAPPDQVTRLLHV